MTGTGVLASPLAGRIAALTPAGRVYALMWMTLQADTTALEAALEAAEARSATAELHDWSTR
jgi:hypothetical protein